MTTMPWRRSRANAVPKEQLDYPFDDLLPETAEPIGSDRADCCVAHAAYLIVLPENADRAQPAELRLCGHHYRSSAAALRRLDAAVFDIAVFDIANQLVGANAPW